jgi:hypothetical protein
MYEDMMS